MFEAPSGKTYDSRWTLHVATRLSTTCVPPGDNSRPLSTPFPHPSRTTQLEPADVVSAGNVVRTPGTSSGGPVTSVRAPAGTAASADNKTPKGTSLP
jgi:hypothetical protein